MSNVDPFRERKEQFLSKRRRKKSFIKTKKDIK